MKDIIEHIDFSFSGFSSLMQKRIMRVLLVCSRYDAFILDEDGRIEDQLFKEYTSLHFRYPPTLIKAHSADEALLLLNTEKADLVVTMLHGKENESSDLCRRVKEIVPDIPVVALMPLNRIVGGYSQENSCGFDYFFNWLGNADILIAIIKVIEDKYNAPGDIGAGVKAILYADSSVRNISLVLPALYKIIFRQTLDTARQEGLNENQITLRKRARPKILLARQYNEAVEYYRLYGEDLIGIITDSGIAGKEEGYLEELPFFEKVKKDNPTLPLIIHSDDNRYERVAKNLEAGFVYKKSRTLLKDMENNITYSFGFGDFIFRMPGNAAYIAHASDLTDFQKQLKSIPDESFIYHTTRNDFYRWFNTRGLFSIARLFKQISHINDSSSAAVMKDFIYKAIDIYKKKISATLVAEFNPSHIDPMIHLYRMGEGSIGGNARGLSFLNQIIHSHNLSGKYENIVVAIPRTLFIGSGFFEEFLDSNKLEDYIGQHQPDDATLQKKFMEAELPDRLQWNLRMYLTTITAPVVVRPSGELDDLPFLPSEYPIRNYVIPNNANAEIFLSNVADAVKAVYASVFTKNGKEMYQQTTNDMVDYKQMAVVLQQIPGTVHRNYFFPLASGVMKTNGKNEPEINEFLITMVPGFYISNNEDKLSLILSRSDRTGLVDIQQQSDTQTTFYALDISSDGSIADSSGMSGFVRIKINEVGDDVFSFSNDPAETGEKKTRKTISITNLLINNKLKLSEVVCEVLQVVQNEINSQVKIDFSIEPAASDKNKIYLYLHQITPFV